MHPLLTQLRELFAEAAFPWAVCGGYALELFAGKAVRTHGDVDLSLPETARADVIAFLLDKGWRIHEYRGMGKVRPISVPADSEPGCNLMAFCGDAPPVQFFPCEEDGLMYHRFIPGMTELNFLDLLFSPVQEKTLRREGLNILAPEVALLYKAACPDEESARLDFAAVDPLLSDEQKQWLRLELTRRYPGGHVWNQPADVQEE